MSFDLGPQGSLHQTVQAVVTVLAVINPVVCGSIFVTLTRSMDSGTQRRAAVRVALVILAILVASALVGLAVLGAFGISLDVFRIVGGMIVAYMGFGMLSGRNQVGQAPPSESDADAGAGGSLAPLIMFAASPGTITAVVTLAAVHTPRGVPLTALTAAVVGTAATFGMLLLAIRAGSRLDRSTQAFVTRFMGLIVASMGMQFVLAGLKAFLAT
jgi:multiple antibiotic resistance protein